MGCRTAPLPLPAQHHLAGCPGVLAPVQRATPVLSAVVALALPRAVFARN